MLVPQPDCNRQIWQLSPCQGAMHLAFQAPPAQYYHKTLNRAKHKEQDNVRTPKFPILYKELNTFTLAITSVGPILTRAEPFAYQ